MNTFELSLPSGEHLGFLLLEAHDDSLLSGEILLFLQITEEALTEELAYQNLLSFPQKTPLPYQVKQDSTEIYTEDNVCIGEIQGAYLKYKRYTYFLNDVAQVI